jgi:hypothetical protein
VARIGKAATHPRLPGSPEIDGTAPNFRRASLNVIAGHARGEFFSGRRISICRASKEAPWGSGGKPEWLTGLSPRGISGSMRKLVGVRQGCYKQRIRCACR